MHPPPAYAAALWQGGIHERCEYWPYRDTDDKHDAAE